MANPSVSASGGFSRIRAILLFCSGHFLSATLFTGFLLLLIELGGIWKEVHEIRLEQVKNQWYELPKQARERVSRLPKGEQVRSTYESTANVEVGNTVTVTIDDQPIQVETDQ